MADTKISALTVATDLTDAVFPIVQGGSNKKAATSLITPAAIGAVASNTAGIAGADAVTNIVSLAQAEYDAIPAPDASTLYVITD